MSPNPTPVDIKLLVFSFTVSASALILLALIVFLFYLLYSLIHRSRTIPFDTNTPFRLQKFSYRELKLATNSFSDENLIGKGGSGTVFRGVLRSGKSIAVKKLNASPLQVELEFQNELHILGSIRSQFVVSLLGYCVEKKWRFLVYQFMQNGSLQRVLFREKSVPLEWDRRFKIILDVARALEFLHLECVPPVIHGDIKPGNVLLGSNFRAKIADFGLSRVKVEGECAMNLCSQELGIGNAALEKDYVREWITTQNVLRTHHSSNEEKNNHQKQENLVSLDKSENTIGSQLEEMKKLEKQGKSLEALSKKAQAAEGRTKFNMKLPNMCKDIDITSCKRNQNSLRDGWKNMRTNSSSSEKWSGELLSREFSSNTSLRGTVCYVAPEYNITEKSDIYSFGVLILVIVSGRRPLHVLSTPMKLKKANLISWCKLLAEDENVLELVDERLKDVYNKEQARRCINLALLCLQKAPELRPGIGDVVKIMKGEMDLPALPAEFGPSTSKRFSRSQRLAKLDLE